MGRQTITGNRNFGGVFANVATKCMAESADTGWVPHDQLTFDPSESPQSQAVPGYEILLKSRTVKPLPGADLGAEIKSLEQRNLTEECDKSLEVAAAWSS
ncbi:hypothetical protein Bbelb_298760 [Branchiostoma belcheri]|nr:hypothetical protein Bbelb_298760 [Branchiostoma belcheri]